MQRGGERADDDSVQKLIHLVVTDHDHRPHLAALLSHGGVEVGEADRVPAGKASRQPRPSATVASRSLQSSGSAAILRQVSLHDILLSSLPYRMMPSSVSSSTSESFPAVFLQQGLWKTNSFGMADGNQLDVSRDVCLAHRQYPVGVELRNFGNCNCVCQNNGGKLMSP